MNKRPTRLAAVLLAMLMCLTLLPVTAMAEIAEFPAKVLTALQSSEGLKTLFTPAETADKPTAQADNEAANEVDTSTAPFTVTDETGESYSLSPTTLSFGGGFGAYYKVVVPKGTETLNIHGETLVTAYCFHGDGNDLGYAASDGTCVVTCHACLNEDEQYYSDEQDWSKYASGDGSYLDLNLEFDDDVWYGLLVQIGETSGDETAPFTVTDANGTQYELSQTSISLDGFKAYYKITVPENYGSLSIRGDGLVFGNCVNGCYGRLDDNPIQANEAFIVESEHSNSSKEGSCLLDVPYETQGYHNWEENVSADGKYVEIQLYFAEDYSIAYGLLVQIGGTSGDTTAPVISIDETSVIRSSHSNASLTFTSNENGAYYYAVADADAEAPTVDTTGEGTAMTVGENTITLNDLTAGAKKLYLIAKDAAGNVASEALVIDIPAYIEPTYKMSLNMFPGDYTSGWRFMYITVDGQAVETGKNLYNATIPGIKEGQVVRVWLNLPDASKALDTISLITDDANKTAVPTTVTDYNSFSFTMPAANIKNGQNPWWTLKDADTQRYSLTATTTKLWESKADSESNRKGTVKFYNEAGAEILDAPVGTRVTAIAAPRDMSNSVWYEFGFVQWKDESGITISDADRKNSSITFTMPASNVSLFAEFETLGTTFTWGSTPGAPEIRVNDYWYQDAYPYRTGVVKTGGAASVTLEGKDGWYNEWEFGGWTITLNGEPIDESFVTYRNGDHATHPYISNVPAGEIHIEAKFTQRKFASVKATVNDSAMGVATVSVDNSNPTDNISVVFEGQTVTLTATPGDRYTLKGWDIKDTDNTTVEYTVAEDVNVATFIMPGTGKDITAKAIFEVDPEKASNECNVMGVDLYSGSTDGAPINQGFAKEGTKLTITLPANMDTVNLADLILKFTVSDYATIKQKDASENWPADGKACGMALDTPVTFTVTAEDGKTTQDYTLTITKAKSSEKEITAVKLLNSDKSVIAEGVQAVSGTTWTITLPSDTDKALIGKIGTSTDVFMQIDYTGVSLAQAEGYSDASAVENKKWSSGNIMCGISPNSSKTFTVTAEDGSTKEYTVEIKYTAPDVPTLSDGSATRTSKTGATVKFTSNEVGTYFYKVVEHGAAAPTVDTSKNGTAAIKGENTIALSNLTEDARDIYIVVKNASGGESAALKVEIPAYGSSETPDTGNFSISVTTPKGGTLTTNRTKADKGDEIIVTVKPDSGYQMVEGSLTYSLAVAGGETVKITGNRFTMPSGNVTITCKWETASVASSGITGFSINGVAGTVNSTTNTITITMPRGTDVTKLTPAISTSGVKSLTPGSGETVNFTNSVTYTATMDDGSTKTYIVTVYVDKGTLADQFWDRLTDFYQQVPWWKYAEQQQSSSKYPKYW